MLLSSMPIIYQCEIWSNVQLVNCVCPESVWDSPPLERKETVQEVWPKHGIWFFDLKLNRRMFRVFYHIRLIRFHKDRWEFRYDFSFDMWQFLSSSPRLSRKLREDEPWILGQIKRDSTHIGCYDSVYGVTVMDHQNTAKRGRVRLARLSF